LKKTTGDWKKFMMIFVVCIPYQPLLVYKIKKRMGLACGTHRGEESRIQIFERESKGKR
jgi:hypothetical protein